MLKTIRILLGSCIWTAVIYAGVQVATDARRHGESTAGQLLRYVETHSASVVVDLPAPYVLALGDAVYIAAEDSELEDPETDGDPGGTGAPPTPIEARKKRPRTGALNGFVQVGEVEAIIADDGSPHPNFFGRGRQVRLRIFDDKVLTLADDAKVRMILVPDAFSWVLDTLFTAETVPEIAREWNATMLAHRDEIFRLITPIVVSVIGDVEATARAEFPPFLARHRAEIDRLLASLETALGDEKIVELFETEIWPLGEQRMQPIVSDIGKEIWKRVPVWGFSWRLVWQALPGTDDNHFEQHWEKFIGQEINPIVRAKVPEVIAAAKAVAQTTLKNERVQKELREAAVKITGDARFHELVQSFLKEAFLDNGEFHRRMLARAQSPEVERALQAASAHLEPMLRRMGDIVFGTREDGITGEFARVLRAQILQKDRRRFVIDPGRGAPRPADAASPLTATVEWESLK